MPTSVWDSVTAAIDRSHELLERHNGLNWEAKQAVRLARWYLRGDEIDRSAIRKWTKKVSATSKRVKSPEKFYALLSVAASANAVAALNDPKRALALVKEANRCYKKSRR